MTIIAFVLGAAIGALGLAAGVCYSVPTRDILDNLIVRFGRP